MVITFDRSVSGKMTLEEFLNYDDGTDTMYELEDGVLLPMPSESEINRRIAMFVLSCLMQLGIPTDRLSMKTEIVTTGSRVRIPDLMVFSEELAVAMEGAKRSIIMPEMPSPLLVIEVVSPNQSSRDYRYKRSEYAARGISEYWIIDPIQQSVHILVWVEGYYEEQVYIADMAIASPIFPQFNLTANQVLQTCL
jgi:Uma2 family endonuclease